MTYALMAATCVLFLAALYCIEWRRRTNYRKRLRLIQRRDWQRMAARR